MRGVVAVLLGLMVGGVAANPNDAFQAGKTLGAGAGQRAASQISTGSAADKVPAYGTNPAEAAYFQGGKGDLTGHGITKMQSCATATPDSDPIKRQECEAVNFLARNPNVRPQFDLSNNPMFDKAKNIRNNAENIFASLGVGGTGSSTQCVPRTITTPAQYSTDTCSSIREVGEQQCTMGRVVNIDADSNFQCEQTINAYEHLSCDDSTLNCTVIGSKLGCENKSTRCIQGASSCCWITITCNGTGSVTVKHGDCCGYQYSKEISDASVFLYGVTYNPAGAKITCNSSGSCNMTFEEYYCSDPSVSIGHYPNANSFNMPTTPVFSCTEVSGGCEALDARTLK